jgi:ubiquinone biosynthesis protein UbiJ
MSSTDSSSDEDAANIAVNKGLLFPNVGHKCLMEKDGKRKKVKSRAFTKYTTSSDEDSSSEDEENLLTLFANLNMQQKEKLNELIGAIHEKDELLDSQEEFLIKENKKHVKVKNAYAQEIEKCENLTRELSICHDTISNLRTENTSLIAKVEKSNVCHDSIDNLRNENASLIAKIDKLNESIASLKTENDELISKAKDLNVCNVSISNLRNENAILHAKIDELNTCKPSTSSVDHVTICTRCRDINVDVIHDHLALIKQQNDHITQLTSKNNEHKIENKKFKFARSMLYSGRRPVIKDGIGFQHGSNVKLNAPKILSNFVKGKALWLRITRVTFYILLVIQSTKLGEFMQRSLILFLTMHLCTRMRHLALGILPMLKCLKRKLLLHQVNLMFHLKLLMHLMCLLKNQAK